MCLDSVWSFLLHSATRDGGLSEEEEGGVTVPLYGLYR